MPELRFAIRWPDGTKQTCYSPSTIVRQYFQPGTSYTIHDFLGRSHQALTAASDRVQAIHGSPCSLALGQLAQINATASRYDSNSTILFESFQE